jgi:ActR/RegA family two-component response regulator
MRKVIMTGYATKENAIRAVNYGADLFLTKPVDLNEFTRAIEEQLQKQLEAHKRPPIR